MSEKFNYSNDQIKDFLDGVFDGSITEHKLPEGLYLATADYLKAGLYDGFGGSLVDFNGKDLELLKELRENTYMFSAAKTYQQTFDQRALLFNEDGERRSMREFSQLGAENFDKWNDAWGRSEYNTAVASAQSASKWNEIEANKDLLPVLMYQTIGDACDICAPLDGITAPVDDPIWDSIMGPNHFNCLCICTQHEAGKELTPDKEKEATFDQVTKEMDDTFKMNSGKDGYIFSPDHPYFDVAPKDRDFAKSNFGLPIPSVAEETGGKVNEFIEAKTIKEAEQWASDKNISINFAENITETERLNTINSIKNSSYQFESNYGKSFGESINTGRNRDLDFVKEINVINNSSLNTPIGEYLRSASDYGKADSLFLNLGKLDKTGIDFAENIKDIVAGKTPLYNITSLSDIITHEASHNYYFGHNIDTIKEFRVMFEKTNIWEKSVSIYGQESASEFFAEAMVSLLRGEKNEAVKIITKHFKL
jgi:hypothetical protein